MGKLRTSRARGRLVAGVGVAVLSLVLAVPALLSGGGPLMVLGLWVAFAVIVGVSWLMANALESLFRWIDRGEGS